MGKLAREKDWSKTSLGLPKNWPTSLKIATSLVLNNPFPMLIVWSKEYIQIYNDGYRPILGTTKHPEALGQNSWNTFSEVWDILKPMFDEVMNGKVTRITDFYLQLNRNGYPEDCYFDFSHSPILQENGTIGGFLVTVIETTEKKVKTDNLKLSNTLYFKNIMQAPIAMCFFRGENYIVDIANEFMLDIWGKTADQVLNKPIFEGLKEAKDQGLEELINNVYQTGESFTAYERPVSLTRKGKLQTIYLNFVYQAFKEEDGTISGVVAIASDVSNQVLSRLKAQESDQKIRSIVENASFPIALYKGKDMLIEFANDALKQAWGKGNDVVGKHFKDVMPEMKSQQINDQLEAVFKSGQAFHAKNREVQVAINGKLETFFYNYSYSPIFNTDGSVYGIMNTSTNVTDLNVAKKKAEEGDKRFRNTVKQAPIGITILRGENYLVEMANDAYLSLVDKTEEEFVNKPLFESLPEVKDAVEGLLSEVYTTGKPYHGIEYPLAVNRYDSNEISYFDFLYSPLREEDGTISGIIVTANEVTESVKAKHFIAESEKQFRTMVMNSPIPMTILRNENFTIEMANKAMLNNIWRKEEKEVVGKGMLDIFPELKEQKYAELLNTVFETGVTHRELESVAYIDGIDGLKKFYVDYEYAPLYEPNGNVSGIMITVNDVTVKVEARIKIEENERKFRLLADSMPQHIWTADIDGNLNYFNKSVFDFSGLNLKQIDIVGWLDIVHPDDREENIKKWLHSISTGTEFFVEHRFRRYDGSFRWQLSRAIPQLDEEGKIIMWVGTSTDIEDQKNFVNELEKQVKERTKELELLNDNLKKSEERYHLMVEEVQDYAILYINTLGIVENWNKGAEKIKGYTAEEIIGQSFSLFYTEDDIKNQLPVKLLQKAAQTGRAAQEGWRVRKDKTLFWANVVITAVNNINGEIIGFSKFTHDLTQKKNAENALVKNAQELVEKNDILERMNKELQSFAYISSHDLQEPLRKIQTFSTQIIDRELENLSESGKDKFQRMQSAAKRMQTLIEDLLAYSRTSTIEKKLELVDLKTIIEDVKEDLSEEIASKNVKVDVIEVCEVNIINFQFRQLVYNLVSNSIKFSSEANQPHVTISCKIASGKDFKHSKLKPELQYCNIKVSDNGIGFDQQYGERIFEVFQRLHGRDKYLGTGIGLAIVKKIVENHDGFITASGELNKGATFDIYFPSV
jgi:PAS domain S-box-containing protein